MKRGAGEVSLLIAALLAAAPAGALVTDWSWMTAAPQTTGGQQAAAQPNPNALSQQDAAALDDVLQASDPASASPKGVQVPPYAAGFGYDAKTDSLIQNVTMGPPLSLPCSQYAAYCAQARKQADFAQTQVVAKASPQPGFNGDDNGDGSATFSDGETGGAVTGGGQAPSDDGPLSLLSAVRPDGFSLTGGAASDADAVGGASPKSAAAGQSGRGGASGAAGSAPDADPDNVAQQVVDSLAKTGVIVSLKAPAPAAGLAGAPSGAGSTPPAASVSASKLNMTTCDGFASLCNVGDKVSNVIEGMNSMSAATQQKESGVNAVDPKASH